MKHLIASYNGFLPWWRQSRALTAPDPAVSLSTTLLGPMIFGEDVATQPEQKDRFGLVYRNHRSVVDVL